MQRIIQVVLPIPHLPVLDYSVSSSIEIQRGNIVVVPFRHKEVSGIVWKPNILNTPHKLKSIISILNPEFNLAESYLKFLDKASNYYLSSIGSITKLALPIELFQKNEFVPLHHDIPLKANLATLSYEQDGALNQIISHFEISQSLSKKQKVVLLSGLTGSGKTELYFHLIDRTIRKGGQVLLMLPEIALTSQMIDRFTKRLGFKPAVWHANISHKTKKQTLLGILTGSVKVVIGARSSLFLPYSKLDLIVIDEEHDQSYKQEVGVLYNARDMAVLRGYCSDIPIVLGSATPSVETYYNSKIGKYQYVALKNRYAEAELPVVTIINMNNQKLEHSCWLSMELKHQLHLTLKAKEQALLFLNRRGYAPLILCRGCGFRFACLNCNTWLVWHKDDCKLTCHHCGYFTNLKTKCPTCSRENTFVACGPGVERIAEEVAKFFPEYRCCVISKDHMNFKDSFSLIKQITEHQVDIIIGTQIITKGYHFPKLNLVSIIDADLGLGGGDIRALEKTFQLLHQVGGRAGREEGMLGRVYIQTYFPDSNIMQMLKTGDQAKFMDYEISMRSQYNFPPFSRAASIILASFDSKEACLAAEHLVRIAPKAQGVTVLGPTEAIISKLKGKYRFRLLIIANRNYKIQGYLEYWLSLYKPPSSVQLKVDVDPYNFT